MEYEYSSYETDPRLMTIEEYERLNRPHTNYYIPDDEDVIRSLVLEKLALDLNYFNK